jgi:molybdopterin synthase catalytic subunit
MQIRLRLFASHRELAGEGLLDLDVPEDSTPEDVFHLLEARNPAVSALRPYTTFAVNREVVEASTPLRHGDEVAFLQPVSGG